MFGWMLRVCSEMRTPVVVLGCLRNPRAVHRLSYERGAIDAQVWTCDMRDSSESAPVGLEVRNRGPMLRS